MDGGSQKTHWIVSTHSRPKAAGPCRIVRPRLFKRFNTQPPEGGWYPRRARAARCAVSTHSRPKAAGIHHAKITSTTKFQHTAARRRLGEGD